MSISKEAIKKAERCLVDNGIEPDEAQTVLQALGYILMDQELYPDKEVDFDVRNETKFYKRRVK